MTHVRRAFTLMELLVVISIITLMLAMLMPSLGRTRETTRRSQCAANIRQAIVGITTLADNSAGILPSGKRNLVGVVRGEHCIWISDELHDDLERVSGTDAVFNCVNYVGGFGGNNEYGWVIGYNYLGNHPRMNELGNFESPIRIDDDPSLPLYVDLNNYTPGGWSFAAHISNGPKNVGSGPKYYNIDTAGALPEANGSEGGNVGLLDSSVNWKGIGEMKEYETGEWGYGQYPCYW